MVALFDMLDLIKISKSNPDKNQNVYGFVSIPYINSQYLVLTLLKRKYFLPIFQSHNLITFSKQMFIQNHFSFPFLYSKFDEHFYPNNSILYISELDTIYYCTIKKFEKPDLILDVENKMKWNCNFMKMKIDKHFSFDEIISFYEEDDPCLQ